MNRSYLEINESILGLNKVDGYTEKVKEAIIFFKEHILRDNKVRYVYLTGCTPGFVRPIFMEIFNLEQKHCILDSTHLYDISRGVIYAYEHYVTNQHYNT